MTTVGIIAEYNPFHYGHKYQIEQAKLLSGADNVIVVMSGNYVQRGEPAIVDKYTRANWAVNNGVSLVLELPVCYSTGSAELFATAAVTILDKLNCVDYISFGCETTNTQTLEEIANILYQEPDKYKSTLKSYLQEGLSYPMARQKALEVYINSDLLDKTLGSPNNILGIEYIKALKRLNSKIKLLPIKRKGSGYHSDSLEHKLASATAIRTLIQNNNKNDINNFTPKNVSDYLSNIDFNAKLSDFNDIFATKLFATDDFSDYLDVSHFLSNKIIKHKNEYTDINRFIELLHSKDETHSHICRAIMHIILDIKKSDIKELMDSDYITYFYPLSYNNNSNILKYIKEKSDLPIVNKFGSFYNSCDSVSKKILDYNILADNLYNYILRKNGIIKPNDFTISVKEKYQG